MAERCFLERRPRYYEFKKILKSNFDHTQQFVLIFVNFLIFRKKYSSGLIRYA